MAPLADHIIDAMPTATTPRARRFPAAFAPLIVSAALAATCAPRAPIARPAPPHSDSIQTITCSCELRSWVVAGRGRHLLLDIHCPPPFDHLTGVVEFASTAFREDFDWTIDPLGMARVSRMTPGVRVRPIFPGSPERLEAEFTIDPLTAECLQRDRVFQLPYFILGPNSNSAIRAACEECGVTIPSHIIHAGGPIGQFPGIELTPGDEIPHAQWDTLGKRPAAP